MKSRIGWLWVVVIFLTLNWPGLAGAFQKATIACSWGSTLAIKIDGTLWAWGDNSSGQLGNYTTTTQYKPIQIGSATNWVAVAAGFSHSLGLQADGTLWAWGDNSSGQLGTGDAQNYPYPVQVGSGKNWVAIAAGNSHSLAIKSDGTLWAWGDNNWGELGLGANFSGNPAVPNQVVGANNWLAVSASGHEDVGGRFSLGLRSDGTLWAWGDNGSGQLGIGGYDSNLHASPVQVKMAPSAAAFTQVAQIATGPDHCLALRFDGSLYSWGDGLQGRLGQGNQNDYYLATRIGTTATCRTMAANGGDGMTVRSDGTLWGWGDNRSGELSLGLTDLTLDTQEYDSPIALNHPHRVALALGGANGSSTCFSMQLRSDHTLWAAGDNSVGQLGQGSSYTHPPNYTTVQVPGLYKIRVAALPWLMLLLQ